MYEIIVYDKHSDITIENSFTDLQHRLATGQAVDSFYYDMEERKAEWWYCGKLYILTDIDYDVIKLATDHSGFCGYDFSCRKVDFYDEEGQLILSCDHDHAGNIPVKLSNDIIRYIFMTDNKAWWIYDGCIRSVAVASACEKLTIGFRSHRYVKEMDRLSDKVYDAYGKILYSFSKHPLRFAIGDKDINIHGREVKPLILERYGLIAVCEVQDYYFSAITLYNFDGSIHAVVPLPEGAVAFNSVKLLEHTDIPVIVCYEELPESTRYFNNDATRSVRPNMPMKLWWYELLADESGKLAMYKSGDLYQGFSDIDTFTLEDRHISWR